MQIIYYEKAVKDHPRTRQIIDRVGRQALLIECDNYQQVFNLKSQNFRIQKQQGPALILAHKNGKKVMPTPEGFGIGGEINYYFSHILNCLYDCRYCFLQGMFPSAHYVVFVNYEEFAADILQVLTENNGRPVYFFSGYDGDSLAFDSVTHFIEFFVPFFAGQPQGILELRTKSANVRPLLAQSPIGNSVVAFSFTPEAISREIEHKVPPLEKRLQAMRQLAQAGWSLGLRFDPLIAAEGFERLYQQLIEQVFQCVPSASIHSVSVGPLRFPQKMYQKMVRLYPQEKLLAQPLIKRGQCYSYQQPLEEQLKRTVINHLQKYIPSRLLFECSSL